MFKNRRFVAAVALLASLSVFGSGCFGTFALTKKVYEFNKGVGDKFVQSIVFWALTIVPIYGIAATVDVVILNLIEFWTGNNPLAMAPGDSQSHDIMVDGTALRLTLSDQGRTLQVAQIENDQLVNVVRMSAPNELGEVNVTRLDGTMVAVTHEVGNGVVVETPTGDELATATSTELAQWQDDVAWGTRDLRVAASSEGPSSL